MSLHDEGPAQLWTARPNGELDDVNAAIVSYFGRSREQMLEWGWADVVHPEDLTEVGERWSASLETGEPYYVEFRLRRHDDVWRWHVGRAVARRDDGGGVVGWSGVNVDVHELFERLG